MDRSAGRLPLMDAATAMLTREEELDLAGRARAGDEEARGRLVTSHLKLADSMARRMAGYGMAHEDMVSQAVAGLVRAVDGFDPSVGTRLSTYAMLWMRAEMQEHVLRNWSLVRVKAGASTRLFHQLGRARRRLDIPDGDLSPADAARLADELRADPRLVVDMDRRLTRRDASLNAPVGDEAGAAEAIDLLASNDADPFQTAAERDQAMLRSTAIADALASLRPRERAIAEARLLDDDGQTLEVLSRVHGVSRERIRQIEVVARRTIAAHVSLRYRASDLLAA